MVFEKYSDAIYRLLACSRIDFDPIHDRGARNSPIVKELLNRLLLAETSRPNDKLLRGCY
jgi:hypothetical protein